MPRFFGSNLIMRSYIWSVYLEQFSSKASNGNFFTIVNNTKQSRE